MHFAPLLAALTLFAVPAFAAAPHLVAHQQLALLANPFGGEHRLAAAVRVPDVSEGWWDDGAHVELGVSNALTPASVATGGYVHWQALSFLGVRAEAQHLSLWPLGVSGAGYYGLSGYAEKATEQRLPAAAGTTGAGWLAALGLSLQGAVDVAPGVRVVGSSDWQAARISLGTAPYYYALRDDLVLAREDVVLSGASLLAAELTFDGVVARVGVSNDYRLVPEAAMSTHQVGPLVMAEWNQPDDTLRTLALFARVSLYTEHPVRAGEVAVLAGVSADYDFLSLD